MKKVHLNENGIKNFITYSLNESLPTNPLLNDDSEGDDYDEYEDETYYSTWEYKNEIEAYLKQVASVADGFVDEDNGQYFIDFGDVQVLFRLDDKQGILYIEKFEMYSRLELDEAMKNDEIIVKVIQFVHQHPLNVSQERV